MPNDPEKTLVTVASFWHESEAWIAQNRLSAEGIQARIDNDHIVGMNWLFANATGGVKIQVAASDAEKALAVLSENRARELPTADPDEKIEEKTCPRCGSPEMYREQYWRRAVFIAWIILGFPLPLDRPIWTCRRCGYCDASFSSLFTLRNVLIIAFFAALAFVLIFLHGQTWFTSIFTPDFTPAPYLN